MSTNRCARLPKPSRSLFPVKSVVSNLDGIVEKFLPLPDWPLSLPARARVHRTEGMRGVTSSGGRERGSRHTAHQCARRRLASLAVGQRVHASEPGWSHKMRNGHPHAMQQCCDNKLKAKTPAASSEM